MMTSVVLVALGGALGASLRFLTGVGLLRLLGPTPFPIAVLTVNVIGSLLMGLFVVLAAHKGLTHLSPLVMTGILGGFTTFSAFSLETVTLFERGDTGQAVLYVGLSVGLSVGALALGVVMGRGIWA